MDSHPLISIAIPAYKTRFLAGSIQSALSQTYDNLEIIIVNDCSPFDVKSIVDQFVDERIHYYENAYNLGRVSIVLNWNRCLSYARGDYFILLCDDDFLHPTFVSDLFALSLKYPFCTVFRARTRLFNAENNEEIGFSPVWPEYEDFGSFYSNTIEKKRHHTITEFMYLTKEIRAKGGFVSFPVGYYSDIASVLLFAQDGGVCSSPEALVTFNKSNDNISSRADLSYEKSKAALAFFRWLKRLFPSSSSQKICGEMLEYDIVSYCRDSSFIDSLRIVMMTPNRVLSLKKKSLLLWKKIQS